MRYAATITAIDNGRVEVRVPDVPEAIASGRTEVEALRRAQRVVLLILQQMTGDGRPLPRPEARGDHFIEVPHRYVEAIEDHAGRPSPVRHSVRSVVSMLLDARKRELEEHLL